MHVVDHGNTTYSICKLSVYFLIRSNFLFLRQYFLLKIKGLLFSWDKLITSPDKNTPTSRRVFLCPRRKYGLQASPKHSSSTWSEYTKTISSLMSNESYFSTPFRCFDCAETQKQPSKFLHGRLAQFSVDNQTSELTCAVLKWMNVCRINFAYVCNGLAARSFPRGKLKENHYVLFFKT